MKNQTPWGMLLALIVTGHTRAFCREPSYYSIPIIQSHYQQYETPTNDFVYHSNHQFIRRGLNKMAAILLMGFSNVISSQRNSCTHYSDIIISAMTSQINGVSIVCSTVCSGADQRKHQSSASLTFVRAIHR